MPLSLFIRYELGLVKSIFSIHICYANMLIDFNASVLLIIGRFKYGEYDGYHTYHEGEEQGT